MFKLFGGRKKPAKAKPRKAPRTPPGEGIRQLAAALPPGDESPPARPLPAPEAAAEPQGQAQPQPQKQVAETPAPDPADRAQLIREAMRIRRNKARDLDNIPARDRKRLQQLAEKMMGVGSDTPAASDAAPPSGRKGGPSGTRH